MNTPKPQDNESAGRSSFESSALHMALLAWKNGGITMIELRRYIDQHYAQERENDYLEGQIFEVEHLLHMDYNVRTKRIDVEASVYTARLDHLKAQRRVQDTKDPA